MKKITLAVCAALLTLLLAVSAFAAEADVAVLALDDLTELPVTSSMDSADSDSAVFFDHLAETGVVVTGNGSAFSVYTASRVPEAISAYAVLLNAEKGTILSVTAYGTNDSSLENWATVIPAAKPFEKDSFRVFEVEESLVKYAFYRFDFTLVKGESFTLAELTLFKKDHGEPALVYAPAASVEVGETLPLVPAPEYAIEVVPFAAAEEKPAKWEPSFGLGLLPGLRK